MRRRNGLPRGLSVGVFRQLARSPSSPLDARELLLFFGGRMSGASLFSVGDSVVLVDALGELRRDEHGKPLRGIVQRAYWYGELVVKLGGSGRVVRTPQLRARRCPSLAYTRPSPKVVGGAA